MAFNVGAIAQQAKASVTGNVETALLVIHDYRELGKDMESTGLMDKGGAMIAINTQRIMDTKNALSTGAPPTYEGSKDKIFRVQFNPSELTLNSSATPKSEVDTTSGKSKTISVNDPKLSLTVSLYFDDMQIYDAFMWDKFTASLTSMATAAVAKGVKTLAKKGAKPHSVQPQVEALVAALRDPYTRTVSFRWADFTFIGQLTTVQAAYTMFSPAGRPVRAKVLLRIQHEMDPTLLNGWYSNFDAAFAGAASKLTQPQQSFQNLLNLNL